MRLPDKSGMCDVRALFGRVASGYDRANRILSLGTDVRWRRLALARICDSVQPRDILDIATGTADFAIEAARRFPDARVTGIDFTPAMLDEGNRKVSQAGMSGRIALVEGDSAALPFAEDSFDLALCAFGFRNFQNRIASLKEAARILHDGGRLVVLEFFRPRSRLLGSFTSWWLRFASFAFVRGRSAEYAYLRESIGKTCSVGEFRQEAMAAGFGVEAESLFLPACTCLHLKKMVK